MKHRIEIPDNQAGRLAYDAFHNVALKMWAVGGEATGNFALANFPEAETVGKGIRMVGTGAS